MDSINLDRIHEALIASINAPGSGYVIKIEGVKLDLRQPVVELLPDAPKSE